MKIQHELKINKEYLARLITGEKKSEIRLNDLDYQLGDALVFQDNSQYFQFVVTHVHSGLGLKEGYVCLSLEAERLENEIDLDIPF